MTKRSPAVYRVQRGLAGAALLVALLLPAGAAQAQATVFRFFDTHTEVFTAPLEGCLSGDLVGTVTLTETSTGQVVDTGKVFTIHGVIRRRRDADRNALHPRRHAHHLQGSERQRHA